MPPAQVEQCRAEKQLVLGSPVGQGALMQVRRDECRPGAKTDPLRGVMMPGEQEDDGVPGPLGRPERQMTRRLGSRVGSREGKPLFLVRKRKGRFCDKRCGPSSLRRQRLVRVWSPTSSAGRVPRAVAF